MEERQDNKPVENRHNINSEEVFTLAKDVFDLRCFIKNIWTNRAHIKRRLDNFVLGISIIFTLLYVAYIMFGTLKNKYSLGLNITAYSVFGLYVTMASVLVALSIKERNGRKTSDFKKYNKFLSVFRYSVRLLSLVMAIVSLVLSVSMGKENAARFAVDTVAIVISIIFIIFSSLPIVFGGIGGLIRWLISPAQTKYKFSYVALEWYGLLCSDSSATLATKKVDEKYVADIERLLDGTIIPELGKKYAYLVGKDDIIKVIDKCEDADISLIEGTLKNIFSYAKECSYIQNDPCEQLDLAGSIEIIEKVKKPNVGMRIGKRLRKWGDSVLSGVLSEND